MNNLVDLREDHVALCKEAHRLRQTPAVRRFLKSPQHDRYDCSFRIHHYLARLGSWSRAACSVVKMGQRFAALLADFAVVSLNNSTYFDGRPLEFEADPETVLNRVLPNYKGTTILSNALSIIHGACKLVERYHQQPPIPQIHAESRILNHFFVNRLEFATGDQYIGCSKPSCYCCWLYFHFHPTRARTGRTHNNVWIKWSLPSPLFQDNGEANRDSLRIMRAMADGIRNEIIGLIIADGNPVVAMFDSTTGLTASARSFPS